MTDSPSPRPIAAFEETVTAAGQPGVPVSLVGAPGSPGTPCDYGTHVLCCGTCGCDCHDETRP